MTNGLTFIPTNLLVAGAGFEPATFGLEPDELPDCSTPRLTRITECKASPSLFTQII